LRYRKEAGRNDVDRVWKLSKGSQNFKVFLNQSDAEFIRNDDGGIVPANTSIKLEYQTKFGAERMTQGELLQEWCAQRFNPGSVTLRYRIDAVALKIISISQVSLEEIEEELAERHNTRPSVMLGSLFNLISCVQRLPEDCYLIQTKYENSCKKLLIYKASEGGKRFTDEPWEITASFTRRWIPIDESTATFLHINHEFVPGCFLVGKKKSQYSYVTKPQATKKRLKVTKPAHPIVPAPRPQRISTRIQKNKARNKKKKV